MITEFAMRAQKLYMRSRAKISCLMDSSFREWKFVSPMAYFSHLKDVSMPQRRWYNSFSFAMGKWFWSVMSPASHSLLFPAGI